MGATTGFGVGVGAGAFELFLFVQQHLQSESADHEDEGGESDEEGWEEGFHDRGSRAALRCRCLWRAAPEGVQIIFIGSGI